MKASFLALIVFLSLLSYTTFTLFEVEVNTIKSAICGFTMGQDDPRCDGKKSKNEIQEVNTITSTHVGFKQGQGDASDEPESHTKESKTMTLEQNSKTTTLEQERLNITTLEQTELNTMTLEQNLNKDETEEEQSSNTKESKTTTLEQMESNTTTSEQNLNTPAPLKYLDCNDISKLEVIRHLGDGAFKSTFEVKLPSGKHAVAKRCRINECLKKSKIRRESERFKALYEQYRDNALRVYGECFSTPVNLLKSKPELITNFSVGDTFIMEMGQPVDLRCDPIKRKCYAEHLTDRDVEDLIRIAHDYAHFAPSPILLNGFEFDNTTNTPKLTKTTDNRCPQQYVSRLDGDDKGRIFHADHDQAGLCNQSHDERLCTIDIALKVNCDLIRILADRELSNCEGWTFNNTNVGGDHMNTTSMVRKCQKGRKLSKFDYSRRLWEMTLV